MKPIYAILIATALLLSACQGAQEPAPATGGIPERDEEIPPAPAMQEEETQGTGPVQEVPSGLDNAFGEVDPSQVITLDDVICEREERSLTFRIRNTDETRSWQLNQDVAYPVPKDLVGVRIMVNNYEANARERKIDNGERLFGPNDKFSDNCAGVEVLGPGESAQCTIFPVPLAQGTENGRGVNDIFVNSPGPDGRVRFTCD